MGTAAGPAFTTVTSASIRTFQTGSSLAPSRFDAASNLASASRAAFSPRSACLVFSSANTVRAASAGTFLGSADRAGPAQTPERQAAAIATQVIKREDIGDLL